VPELIAAQPQHSTAARTDFRDIRPDGAASSDWRMCPDCKVERTDYEGEPSKYLEKCPNCGSKSDPVDGAASSEPPSWACKRGVATSMTGWIALNAERLMTNGMRQAASRRSSGPAETVELLLGVSHYATQRVADAHNAAERKELDRVT